MKPILNHKETIRRSLREVGIASEIVVHYYETEDGEFRYNITEMNGEIHSDGLMRKGFMAMVRCDGSVEKAQQEAIKWKEEYPEPIGGPWEGTSWDA